MKEEYCYQILERFLLHISNLTEDEAVVCAYSDLLKSIYTNLQIRAENHEIMQLEKLENLSIKIMENVEREWLNSKQPEGGGFLANMFSKGENKFKSEALLLLSHI